jgi:hypothetical protein
LVVAQRFERLPDEHRGSDLTADRVARNRFFDRFEHRLWQVGSVEVDGLRRVRLDGQAVRLHDDEDVDMAIQVRAPALAEGPVVNPCVCDADSFKYALMTTRRASYRHRRLVRGYRRNPFRTNE